MPNQDLRHHEPGLLILLLLRIPLETLHFSAYSASDLLAIIKARLTALLAEERKIFTPVVLNFLSERVAATNGDIRYTIRVLRPYVDSAEQDATAKVEMERVFKR